jgi:hypothetical protein
MTTKGEIALAATFMGSAAGYVLNDRSTEVDYSDLLRDLTRVAPLAVEMVDVAIGVAMQRPDDLDYHVYDDFGTWFATYCADNDQLPDDEEIRDRMAEDVYGFFEEDLTDEQQASLKQKLADVDWP